MSIIPVYHEVIDNFCHYKIGYGIWEQGDCDGYYRHYICKNPTCDMGADHYDHGNKIHYYHLCWFHTPKDIHNGECPTRCNFRTFVRVVIDGVVQV